MRKHVMDALAGILLILVGDGKLEVAPLQVQVVYIRAPDRSVGRSSFRGIGKPSPNLSALMSAQIRHFVKPPSPSFFGTAIIGVFQRHSSLGSPVLDSPTWPLDSP
eukprot:Lithocolla_globosa_v1_NODE_13902_length_340_cov_1.505263.p1 type:complete len:106 gc:universal NODE_13902_length_340_cov_1.505263:340-23(-)